MTTTYKKVHIRPVVNPASNEPHTFKFGMQATCSESGEYAYIDGPHDVTSLPAKTIYNWTQSEIDAQFELWLSNNDIRSKLDDQLSTKIACRENTIEGFDISSLDD